MNSLTGFTILLALSLCSATITAQRLECKNEQYEYAPDRYDEFCVFRAVQWKKGAPEPEFATGAATKVVFVDSNFTRLPDRFFQEYAQLEWLAVRNTSLEVLPIKNRLKRVYAVENQIKSLQVEGGKARKLTALSLRNNPYSDVTSIVQQLPALEWLDLSHTEVTSDTEHTIELSTYAQLVNLTELYVTHVQAYYLENEAMVPLPALKLLDVSGNLFTPSNFHLRVFSTVPNLEELFLRDAMMSDLSVSDIRQDLPTLKRIHLDGNDFNCKLLNALVAHLKEKDIEAPGGSTRCLPGYNNVEGLCCKSYSNNFPTVPATMPSTATPPRGSEDRDITTTTTMTPSVPVPGSVPVPAPVDTTKTGGEAAEKEEGTPIGMIVGIVVGLLAVFAIAAFVVYKIKQKNAHQPVSTNDNL